MVDPITSPELADDAIASLHSSCAEESLWTTVNAAEFFPGTFTPLGWTWLSEPIERGARLGFHALGLLTRREAELPTRTDHRITGTPFYGRLAVPVDMLRWIGDRLPGTSGDSVEAQFFGSVRPGVTSHPTRSRYLPLLVRAPFAMRRAVREVQVLAKEMRCWWLRATDEIAAGANPEQAMVLAREAQARLEKIFQHYSLVAMLAQAGYEQVRRLCNVGPAENGPLLNDLVVSGGSAAGIATVSDLWAVAHGGLELPAFLRRHGFHGPGEGMLHSRSWREDPSPVLSLVQMYRTMNDAESPTSHRATATKRRDRSEQDFLSRLPWHKRTAAVGVLRFTRWAMSLREVGRQSVLTSFDVARAALRSVGADLARSEKLDEPDDVFLLTWTELQNSRPFPALTTLAQRRAIGNSLARVQLPTQFIGRPQPAQPPAPLESDDPILGVAASPGIAVGRACVIVDPNQETDLQAGDILVCVTTDPGWASRFLTADGLVIDIGGPISHGAVVARELGIPCVIGTQTGTTRLRTGDTVRVDGSEGRVDIIRRGRRAAPNQGGNLNAG